MVDCEGLGVVGSGAGGAMRKSAEAGPDHAGKWKRAELGGKGNWEWRGGNRRRGGKDKEK